VSVGSLLFIPIRYLSILLSVAIAIGLYFFFLGFRLLARKRSLLTIPTSEIRSAARGLVEVSGLAAGPCTTVAPITGEPCFLYHTTAWQQREGKKNQWQKVADETLHLPFFIDDSTGQLLIEAPGADLDLHPRFRGEYASTLLDLDDVPQSVSSFLSRHGIAFDRNLRIEERLIKAEDALFVVGTLAENSEVHPRLLSPRTDDRSKDRSGIRDNFRKDKDNDFRNDRNNYRRKSAQDNLPEQFPAPEIIRLDSSSPSSTREMSQQAKIAAALSRAGIARPQDWSPAKLPHTSVAIEENAPPPPISSRSEMRLSEMRLCEERPDEARPDEHQLASSEFNLALPVVLRKGANEGTFVISFRSQKEVVSATAWKAAAMVSGGTAVMLLGIYMLWTQMASL
jgi:E3 Ubiquitin ligase